MTRFALVCLQRWGQSDSTSNRVCMRNTEFALCRHPKFALCSCPKSKQQGWCPVRVLFNFFKYNRTEFPDLLLVFLFCFVLLPRPFCCMNPFTGPKLYERYILNQTDQKCSFLGLFSLLKFKHNFTTHALVMEILCHGRPHYVVWRSYGRHS